jgi:hypothetical protein
MEFYNKTFKKKTPMENEVILLHASAEVVHPREMEPFDVAEVIDPHEQNKAPLLL